MLWDEMDEMQAIGVWSALPTSGGAAVKGNRLLVLYSGNLGHRFLFRNPE